MNSIKHVFFNSLFKIMAQNTSTFSSDIHNITKKKHFYFKQVHYLK